MLSREQVRRVDALAVEQFYMPSIVLMENAGRGVAETMSSLDIDGSVVILCGPGNNGGDGLVVARHLDALGYDVELFSSLPSERWQGDAETNYRIVSASGCSITCCAELESDSELRRLVAERFDKAAWIVDCLLGTGATGAVRSPCDILVRLANASNARRLAVDVPSGLDCDTGEASDPTFEADHTCTLVAEKPGLVTTAAAAYVGELHVIDIGLPRALIESVMDGA